MTLDTEKPIVVDYYEDGDEVSVLEEKIGDPIVCLRCSYAMDMEDEAEE